MQPCRRRMPTGHTRNHPLILQDALRAGAHTTKYIHCSLADNLVTAFYSDYP